MSQEHNQLAYDLDGTGPLLVAVHGITENRSFWDPVCLQQHFRVPRVDRASACGQPGAAEDELSWLPARWPKLPTRANRATGATAWCTYWRRRPARY
ncbi:alpha/beta fold hydrolase [Streptomyces rishiriensis]|uniref:Uncharacterized protein n=1 Tax=Streptomyces rishiriensis TaxID=68264 RepID=A0ABU0NIT2_STRRH|nr:hypothetical protein [Streptomyces rishiriensis]MDQ0578728.1 hypothetical protein [Streptomyces rishiriensis]